MKVLYPIIDGEITGGNIICLEIIEEALRRGYGVVVNSPTQGKFTQLLREKGIKVYNINTRRTFRLDSALKLIYLIKKEKISIIHSHAPFAGTVLSRLAGWMAGIPVINHVHMPYFMELVPIKKWYQFLLNWITSRFIRVKSIAVSEFVKNEIIKQGTPLERIIVVYNGIGLDGIRYKNNPAKVREEFGLRQDHFIIGEVGRLGLDKGQHTFIKAAEKVIKDYPDAVFMIVGEELTKKKEYRKALERLVSDLGLEEKIIFTGYRADVMDLMSIFEILVLPSPFAEGLAVVILEAMAAKKPVIATSVGGNPEIVVDGQTGTLIPPQDPAKLTEAIEYHLSHPEASKQMGAKGYERVKQHFSLSEMLGRVMDIYNGLLTGK